MIVELLLSSVVTLATVHVAHGNTKCVTRAQCNKTINVRWWSKKPYIYYIENTTRIDGFFPEILELLVNGCCGMNCTKINYKAEEENENGLMKNFQANSYVNFPVFGTMMDTSKVRKPFLPLIESPGIVYLSNKAKVATSTYHVVIQAVTKAWPFLIFIYLGAALSGIVVWALDCYCNWEQFPVSFFKGSWEGFWWSIVSMTTVGYGDRCPKSPAARVFSIAWVMIGLVMIALFNGALTTELTAFSMTSSAILQGEKVAVLIGTAEDQYSSTINVNKHPVANMTGMKKMLEGKEHSLLLETYVAGAYRSFLNSSGNLMLSDVFEYNFAYGMLLSGVYETSPLKKCLERQLSTNVLQITNIILKQMEQKNYSTINFSDIPIEQMKKDHLLSPFGPVPQLFYIVCSVLVCLFVIGGMIWQFRKKMNEKGNLINPDDVTIPDCNSIEELMALQNKELQTAMSEEVEKFYKAWTIHKDKIFKRFSSVGWYKNIAEEVDSITEVSNIDVPKYDYIDDIDKFELTNTPGSTTGFVEFN